MKIEDSNSFFLHTKVNLRPAQYQFVGLILGRRGTGDEWSPHLSNWKFEFQKEMKKRYRFDLDPYGRIYSCPEPVQDQSGCQIPTDVKLSSVFFGRYRFVSAQQGTTKFSKCKWLKHLDKNPGSPYVCYDQIVGFVEWEGQRKSPELLFAMMGLCRGIIARLDDPSKFVWCVHLASFGILELVNNYDNCPPNLIVSPSPAITIRIKYLNDLVDVCFNI